MTPQPSDEDRGKNIKLDEFLFNTIVELKITLSKLESDSDEKSDILHDVIDNLTAIAYNMKEVKDKLISTEEVNKRMLGALEMLQSRVEVLGVKSESDNVQLEGHVKEIKYAIQQLKDSMLESAGREARAAEKKSFSEYLSEAGEAIKNVRAIFVVLLIISLLLSTIFGTKLKETVADIKPFIGLAK